MVPYGLTLNKRMEEFSYAYIHAVASVVGCTMNIWRQDEESIDVTLRMRGGDGPIISPELDIQAKCTGQNALLHNDHIAFPLPIKNYDDLRLGNTSNPNIFLVLIVPPEIEKWLQQSEDLLAMYHCGYWMSLRGMPPTDNESSVTVKVPRNQMFSVEALEQIMQDIRYKRFS